MQKGIIIKILSIVTAVLLMFPYAVKFEHTHHHHFHASHADECGEKHLEPHEDECEICQFEYSIFLNDLAAPLIEKKAVISSHYIFPKQIHLFSTHLYSFQLRAPPAIF